MGSYHKDYIILGSPYFGKLPFKNVSMVRVFKAYSSLFIVCRSAPLWNFNGWGLLSRVRTAHTSKKSVRRESVEASSSPFALVRLVFGQIPHALKLMKQPHTIPTQSTVQKIQAYAGFHVLFARLRCADKASKVARSRTLFELNSSTKLQRAARDRKCKRPKTLALRFSIQSRDSSRKGSRNRGHTSDTPQHTNSLVELPKMSP